MFHNVLIISLLHYCFISTMHHYVWRGLFNTYYAHFAIVIFSQSWHSSYKGDFHNKSVTLIDMILPRRKYFGRNQIKITHPAHSLTKCRNR